MNVFLENDVLAVAVKINGAELTSVFHKVTSLEYMWGADPAFWGKTSPVLFPIVGTLKEDTLIYDHKKYHITRHGFARDLPFEVETQQKDSAVFVLKSNEITKEKYPFDFEFRIKYELDKNVMRVTYDVRNADQKEMYFSVGAHPAFNVPLVPGTDFDDYYLEFNKVENASRWPINKAGLIESEPVALINNSNRLNLTRALFLNDALVFKNLNSTQVAIKSGKTERGLQFYFDGFPYLGIWAAKNANFVCIEPWCGIADSVDHNQLLVAKEGVEKIQPRQQWFRRWCVEFN